MGPDVLKLEDDEVQFVFDNSELVLDPSEFSQEQLTDLVYTDGGRAIFVNGHILQEGDHQAIVLQEGDDLTQYYVNENSDEIFVTDESNLSVDNSLQGGEIVQFIQEEDQNSSEQIVYITQNDEFVLPDDINETYQIEEFNGEIDEDSQNLPLKTIKLEAQQVLDIDDLIEQQNIGEVAAVDDNERVGYQYAILKDGKLHIQHYNANDFVNVVSEEVEDPPITEENNELLKITGRNLLTGQTVTLHNYLEKLQKKLLKNEFDVQETSVKQEKSSQVVDNFKKLLNKKIPLNKTVNGKRLVGKIIHVENKSVQEKVEKMEISDKLDESIADDPLNFENIPNDSANVAQEMDIAKQIVDGEQLEQISRTMSGLMNMETVRKKLSNKTIVIKVIETVYMEHVKSTRKRVTYSYGYMEQIQNPGDEEPMWVYKCQNGDEDQTKKYPKISNITVLMSTPKNGNKSIKVILGAQNEARCKFCHKKFPSKLQLKAHLNNCQKVKTCEVCLEIFTTFPKLQEHRKNHVAEGKLLECHMCSKVFLSTKKLKKHEAIHVASSGKSLECTICLEKYASLADLKKHLVMHMSAKPYQCHACMKNFSNLGDLNFHKRIHDLNNYFQCETCGRYFSRYSNLMRHVEIHKGAEALYQCEICGSSYHYISSLTRHMVQNHITKDNKAPNTTQTS